MHLDDLLYRYALTYEETWARELATELKQHNVWVTSTLGEILREESLGKVNYQQHPERKYVFPGMWQTWDPELGHRHPMKDEQRKQYDLVEEKAYAFIKLMQSAEVGLLAPDDDTWFVVFEYEETGHIKDDEKLDPSLFRMPR